MKYLNNCSMNLVSLSDSLTLQLWRDLKERESRSNHATSAPSKGSIALEGYLGWEAGFSLDRESLTLALVLQGALVVMAFESKETLMRWQVRDYSKATSPLYRLSHYMNDIVAVLACY